MRELYGILVSAFTLPFVVLISALENASTDVVKSERVGLYVLMLPESSMEKVLSRYRQEEEAAAAGLTFAQTGQQIGQIISGILGGDVRPIFAGSVGFVQNQNAAAGLQAFLGSIAPGVNLALREMYSRVRTRLGFAPPTTLATPIASNVTAYGNNAAGQQQLQPPAPTTAWQYILNQIGQTSTTVEPLPLLKIVRPGGDEDDDGEFRNVV